MAVDFQCIFWIFLCLRLVEDVASQRSGVGLTPSCTSPPHIPPSRLTPPASLDSLLREGRCNLGCLHQEPSIVIRDDRYAAWPFIRFRRSSCADHKVIHECTRGCSLLSTYTFSERRTRLTTCPQDCVGACREECGDRNKCSNPDQADLWMREGCQITCNSRNCEKGCNLVDSIFTNSSSGSIIDIGSGGNIVNTWQVPLSPVGPPSLTEIPSHQHDSSLASFYDIDLRNAVPMLDELESSSSLLPVAFLFRVSDHVTRNISYIWQSDPSTPFPLIQHSCHNVTVTFAVVNIRGTSAFSPPLTLLVSGDERAIPLPAHELSNQYVEDTRVGFFGHFVLTLNWLSPSDTRHLDNFTVCVRTRVGAVNRMLQRTVRPSMNGMNSIELRSEEPSSGDGVPFIMTKTYLLSIISVGRDGKGYLNDTLVTTQAISYSMFNFMCSKHWDGQRYFSFQLTWILPQHWASTNVVSHFTLTLETISPAQLYGSYHETMVNNKTHYSRMFDHSNVQGTRAELFYRPKSDPDIQTRFELAISWNQRWITFTPQTSAFHCLINTISPPPSQVRNFSVVSYEVQDSFTLLVSYKWTVPSITNGELSQYHMCISLMPLEEDAEPDTLSGNALCTMPEGSTLSVNHTWKFFTGHCLYSQIQARNEFIYGNWTEPILLELVPSCGGVAPTTTSMTPSMTPSPLNDTSPPLPSETPLVIILSTIFGVLLALAVVVLVVCVVVCLRIQKKRKLFFRRTEAYPPNNLIFNVGRMTGRRQVATTPTAEPLILTDEWEVPPSEIIVGNCLGEGAFGEVFKGTLKGPIACSKVRPELRKAVFKEVAIKLLKSSARGSERQDFLSEIEMMKKVSEGHNPHVVGMLGCVTVQEPLCLVTEFVQYGDLLSYLRTNRRMFTGGIPEGDGNPYLSLGELSSADLISFAYQIASGMEYLSSIGIVHRDLACRNILVDDDKVLKITDFGMSREAEEIYVQKSKARVPFKWMAIESIVTREFTSASDVWSYGITLWEIGTLGGVPYPTIDNTDLLSLLTQGYRMEKPDNCSPEIYDVMLSCWHGNPRQRPSFTDLRNTFDHMLLAGRKGDYIEFNFDLTKSCYQSEENNESSDNILGLLNISQIPRRRSHMSENEESMQLLPTLKSSDCQAASSVACNGISRFSPLKHSPRQQSPQHQSPRQRSPNDRLSLSQSPRKQSLSERQSPRPPHSPMQLFVGRHSSESVSSHSRSPFHATNMLSLETGAGGDRENHRPTSLFFTRDRDQRNRRELSDRYVKEPTKLANLNLAVDQIQGASRSTELTVNGEVRHLRLRRGSEGMLNMNSDGYVSFIGMNDRRANRSSPQPDIQITVTDDL